MRSALILLALIFQLPAADFATLLRDRTAVERVYHDHRTGEKPPFEQAVPGDQLRCMVEADMKKEAVLKRVYHVEISDAEITAEITRINQTTRAPEILAGLQAALGGDPKRFGEIIAKPILVDKTLRARFENDPEAHAAQRQTLTAQRDSVLAAAADPATRLPLLRACPGATLQTTTWPLTPAPVTTKSSSANYSVEATLDLAPSDPAKPSDTPAPRLADLPAPLQDVLRTQLLKPGDLSPVVETPTDFRLLLCQSRDPAIITAATLTLPKKSFEDWLLNH